MKRFFVFCVSLLAFFMIFALPVNAVQAGEITTSDIPVVIQPFYSGGCGSDGNPTPSSNVKWTLNTATGVLTISGSGEMKDYPNAHSIPYSFLKDYIKSVTIENGVTGIGDFVFCGCDRLTAVIIPASVVSIGNHSFSGCTALTGFTVPDSIATIGSHAFSFCWKMTTLTIGSGVTSIGKGAFEGLSKLTVLYWNAPNVSNFGENSDIFACAGYLDAGITVTFGENVTAVPAYAFSGSNHNSPKIIAVNLGSNIVTIGDYAFYRLWTLPSITIPFATNAIGSHAFCKCCNTFFIRGYTFSYAEAYADENNIPFSSLGYKYFDIVYYDGEDTLSLTPAQYAYGIGEDALPTPEKTGHTFDGWYDNEDLTGNTVTAIGTTQTGSVKLYSKWTLLTYGITASAGAHGSISPSSATVDYGNDQTFAITPDEGYDIKDVLVDGVSVGAVSSYEFKNVIAAHSITATFSKQTFAITVDAGENGSISPSSATVDYGDDQTFAITPDEGYDIKDVLVDGVSVGAVPSYTFQNVTATHTIAASFKKIITITFCDVPAGAWYENYVYDLVRKGILCGYANGNGICEFRPQQNITRAEFAAVLARVSGEDMSDYENKTSFNDVSKTFWGAKYIEWAYQNNVVNGTGNGKYHPDSSITRQEMAVMIYRFATDYKGDTLPQTNAVRTFSDQGDIASWAQEAVTAMQRAGIIDGMGNGNGTFRFAPQANATRAQAAKMISVYLSL